MPNVVFALPYGLPATMRFLDAVARLPGVQTAVISQESADRVPEPLRKHLAGHERIADVLSAEVLETGVRSLANRCFQGRVDALLGILEPMQEAMGRVRERLGIRGMTEATAHNFRDKSRMKELLSENGLPCARYGLARTVEEGVQLGQSCGLPVVVKPPAGAGARSTWRADDVETLHRCLKLSQPSAEAPVLIEEFVRGKEHSFDTVSIGGRHVLHSISHYYPTPLEVLENDWIQWCVLLPRQIDGSEYQDIHEAGRRTLDVLGMDTGITHMEWFRRPDGSLAISEVAARPPGAQFTSLLSYAYDVSFYRLWAELGCFGRCDLPERKFAAGAVYLRGQGEGRVKAVHGLERIAEEVRDVVVEAKIPQRGQPAQDGYEGEGHILVRHPETQAVERALKLVLQRVRVELES